MFDVGFSELLLLAIVALVVIGPEKLPHTARIIGAWVGRIRRTVSTMQADIEREVAAQEIKTKLESELKDMGGGNLLQELQEEKRQLETSWQEAEQDISAAVSATPTAVDEPPRSVLADVAKPLDSVELDGDKAYREWLESQRRNRIAPPKNPPAEDQPAS